jgi:hypothetical protein
VVIAVVLSCLLKKRKTEKDDEQARGYLEDDDDDVEMVVVDEDETGGKVSVHVCGCVERERWRLHVSCRAVLLRRRRRRQTRNKRGCRQVIVRFVWIDTSWHGCVVNGCAR